MLPRLAAIMLREPPGGAPRPMTKTYSAGHDAFNDTAMRVFFFLRILSCAPDATAGGARRPLQAEEAPDMPGLRAMRGMPQATDYFMSGR